VIRLNIDQQQLYTRLGWRTIEATPEWPTLLHDAKS
jgi:hypothetical protein